MTAHRSALNGLVFVVAVATHAVAPADGRSEPGPPASAVDQPDSGKAAARITPCRLAEVPDQPLVRDRHTCLLASFDAADTNDAEFARVERREVGVGNQPTRRGGLVAEWL